jgi:RNA polymerase sigma factor (sigma-70 family)
MIKDTFRQRVAEFFGRERKRLLAYVHRLIEDTAESDSEDILQDVVLNLLNKADITEPIENLSAYVYEALRNRVIDYFRRRKKNLPIDSPLTGDEMTLADVLHDTRFDTARIVEQQEIRNLLLKAIEALSEEEQELVIATEFQGVSFKELVNEWHIPLGTLLARKSRAIAKIKKTLHRSGVRSMEGPEGN